LIEDSVPVVEKVSIKKEEVTPTKTTSFQEKIIGETATKITSTELVSKIVDVPLPDLGENIDSASVVNVLIKPGDMISRDQSIIEIETDKATVEVPSPYSGKVVEVFIKQGVKVKVGESLIKLKVSYGVQESQLKIEDKSAKPKLGTAEEITLKIQNESIQREERTIEISGQGYHQPSTSKGSAPAAPSVRRIARELGIDIKEVPGSGISRRISMDDVKAYVKKLNEQRRKGISPGFGIKAEKLPDFSSLVR